MCLINFSSLSNWSLKRLINCFHTTFISQANPHTSLVPIWKVLYPFFARLQWLEAQISHRGAPTLPSHIENLGQCKGQTSIHNLWAAHGREGHGRADSPKRSPSPLWDLWTWKWGPKSQRHSSMNANLSHKLAFWVIPVWCTKHWHENQEQMGTWSNHEHRQLLLLISTALAKQAVHAFHLKHEFVAAKRWFEEQKLGLDSAQ